VTKPKFTPDPPPVGGSSEERVAWTQRQYARIEDWWPKDLEDRLAALELRFPYKSGTWPIVDASSVKFTAEARQLYEPVIYLLDEDNKYEQSLGCATDFDGVTRDRTDSVDLADNIAVSDQGHAIFKASGSNTDIGYTDGTNWETYSTPSGGNATGGIVWIEDRYIEIKQVTGGGLVVHESLDGKAWSTVFSSSSTLYAVGGYTALATDGETLAFAGSNITTGQRGTFTSADKGQSWTFHYGSEFTRNPSSMFYANGSWFVGSFLGRCWRSTTGPTGPWTQVFSVGSLVETPVQVLYGGGKWMALVTEEDYILVSDDGSSWSQGKTGIGSFATVKTNLNYVDGCGWIWTKGSNCDYSEDGVNWFSANNTLIDIRATFVLNRAVP